MNGLNNRSTQNEDQEQNEACKSINNDHDKPDTNNNLLNDLQKEDFDPVATNWGWNY